VKMGEAGDVSRPKESCFPRGLSGEKNGDAANKSRGICGPTEGARLGGKKEARRRQFFGISREKGNHLLKIDRVRWKGSKGGGGGPIRIGWSRPVELYAMVI